MVSSNCTKRPPRPNVEEKEGRKEGEVGRKEEGEMRRLSD